MPLLLAIPLTAALVAPAAATPLADPSVSGCTTDNCSSVELGGTVLGFGTTLANPWVAEILTKAGECLRLDVLSQADDLKMTVVAPHGVPYVSDDRPGDHRPLVKIDGTQSGWHTVTVTKYNGLAIDADFTLAYGRYSPHNPNCASPTPPSLGVAGLAAKARAAGPSPQPTGGPGGR